MAAHANHPAAPCKKGIVHILTQSSFGGDEAQMTCLGCFLRVRNQEISCCNCYVTRVKEIKAKNCLTTVVGLDEKLKHDVVLADLKKELRCGGDIDRTAEFGMVIRLHTGRTEEVKNFLWKSGLAAKGMICCKSCV